MATTNPIVRKLGFVGHNADLADSFLRSVRHRGYSTEDGARILEWYVSRFGTDGRVNAADASSAFLADAERHAWGGEIVDSVYGWFDAVNAQGGDPAAIAPVAEPVNKEADAARLREIQNTLRTDRRKYFEEGMDHEMLHLNAKHGDTAALPPPTNARRTELEQLMRTDRASYFKSGGDQEYRALIEHQSGESAPGGDAPLAITHGGQE